MDTSLFSKTPSITVLDNRVWPYAISPITGILRHRMKLKNVLHITAITPGVF